MPMLTLAWLDRLDRKHPKKCSDDDWIRLPGWDAKITKVKDRCTRLVHNAEHAVDPETGRRPVSRSTARTQWRSVSDEQL